MLPQKSLVRFDEKTAAGRKKQMERVTINLCSNASGSIQLPVHIIGKSNKPRCFKNFNPSQHNIIYDSQRSSWMTIAIFKKWFHQNFIPYVQKHLGQSAEAILLLDNCSAHPQDDELISSNGKIRAMFLPPNVTSLIQPMDQGVIESVKRQYRKKLCQSLILADASSVSIPDFLKTINLKYVCESISQVWSNTNSRVIVNAWSKLFGANTDTSLLDTSISEISEMFKVLSVNSDQDVNDWLGVDTNMPGHEHLSDAEIVNEVMPTETAEESDEDPSEDVQEKVPDSAALNAIETVCQWYQQQGEYRATIYQTLTSVRDLAAGKRVNTLKQSTIDRFFNNNVRLLPTKSSLS